MPSASNVAKRMLTLNARDVLGGFQICRTPLSELLVRLLAYLKSRFPFPGAVQCSRAQPCDLSPVIRALLLDRGISVHSTVYFKSYQFTTTLSSFFRQPCDCRHSLPPRLHRRGLSLFQALVPITFVTFISEPRLAWSFARAIH